MEKQYRIAQELIACLSGLHLIRVPATDTGVLQYRGKSLRGIVTAMNGGDAFLALFRAVHPGAVYILKSCLNIHHVVMLDGDRGEYLILGPCLTAPFLRSDLRQWNSMFSLPPKEADTLIAAVSALPVILEPTLHRLGTILADQLLELPQPVSCQRLEERPEPADRQRITLVEQYEDPYRIRQTEARYELSAAMTEAVKQGNLSLAYQLMQSLAHSGEQLNRNPDPLRNAQNLCITMNTQFRYALEEVGIHPYQLDRVSGAIAVQIEKLRSTGEAQQYSLEILQEYCKLAREHTTGPLRPLTRLAVTYIKTHLSDTLTVADTARALTIHPNYLSTQFHQDTGLTFTEYVNRERAYQAAALLSNTNLQIQQISASVGYNNTSYFARQFSKYMGMTPRAYREGK